MSKKEWFLVGLVVALVGLYAVYFTDWFRPKIMRIEHSTRGLRVASMDPRGGPALGSVTFALHRNYKLTSVKVVPLAEFQTNKYAPPLWELVADSGSKPVDGFAYGFAVPGMTPKRPLLETGPLVPGVEYRLIITAGSVKGEHDFKLDGPRTARR